MSGRPLLASARIVAAACAAMTFGAACNAIVGNGDFRLATESGPPDGTVSPDASAEAASATNEAGEDATYDSGEDASDAADGSPEASAAEAGCEAGTKACPGRCATFDDPGYGCGPTRCTPCEVPNAVAGCGEPDGGTGDQALVCSVALCKGTHADCNGTPLDGCETDTSDDLYNCGACGHDCSKLPHVAGNVTCTAGACTFDGSACAPGYGICSTNPDDGCDTVISDPGHCGGCSTSCTAGFPYCSPTGSGTDPFSCTSGCATGLSLCGASCVNEQTDPNHCGGCAVQCPAVAGGTPTCSQGATCGFNCNANYHGCGTGNGATCATNSDPNHCGVSAACGACPAPANATPTCTGGATCGYACVPGSHACGAACELNGDPNNCGTLCGTNCPGPARGSGVAVCSGNACAIACSGGESLCYGNACVDEQTDSANCGQCGKACAAGQTCSSGQCACTAVSCPNGCCDASGTCQMASTSASCGTGGTACAPGCPLTLPEASHLALWLVGDAYVSHATTWTDQSGHADATCVRCPSVAAGALNGHNAVSFHGSSYFALGDPASLYEAAAFTIFIVAAPDDAAVADAQLLGFSDGNGNSLSLQRSDTDPDLLLQMLPGANANTLIAPGAWGAGPELIAAGVDSMPSAFLTVGTTPVTGPIGSPAGVDYVSSYLGTDPATQTLTYTGQIAEVLVYNTALASTSASSLQTYLATRYMLP